MHASWEDLDALTQKYSEIHGMWASEEQFTDEMSVFNDNMNTLVFDALGYIRPDS